MLYASGSLSALRGSLYAEASEGIYKVSCSGHRRELLSSRVWRCRQRLRTTYGCTRLIQLSIEFPAGEVTDFAQALREHAWTRGHCKTPLLPSKYFVGVYTNFGS